MSSDELPYMICLCPTYHRPKLLQESIEMFRAQTYPKDCCELLVFDDGASTDECVTNDVGCVLLSGKRCPSLPDKYNDLMVWAAYRRADMDGVVACVWEDDDIYKPDYLLSHAKALTASPDRQWSKPSRVLSDYPGHVVEEGAAGRFHATLAIRLPFLLSVGGWVRTKRADFDQLFMTVLHAAGGPPADPCEQMPPQYVFRYGSTGEYHGQHFMSGPADETWWDKAAKPSASGGGPF